MMMNTDRYAKSPLWMIVYVKSGGKPVSYQRIYQETAEKMEHVYSNLLEFFGRDDRQDYISVEDLAVLCDMNPESLRRLLMRMASLREIHARVDGVFRLLRSEPYVILQQMPKHLHPNKFKCRTPVMVFPFSKDYFDYLDFDDAIGVR